MKEIKTCEEIFLKLSGLYYSMLPAKAVIKVGKKIAEEKEKGKQRYDDHRNIRSCTYGLQHGKLLRKRSDTDTADSSRRCI